MFVILDFYVGDSSTTGTDKMVPPEWTRIFQNETNDLRQGDSWCLEFDYSIKPEDPEQGWKEYIRNTSAWFTCTKCGRGWPSNRVKVFFHMRLMEGQGIVKVRPYRQNCKKCNDAPMEEPSITSDNIGILLKNLIKTNNLKKGDSWRLEFDENIEPNNPNPGWEQYIKNTGA
eukprot:superscaffoldBa00000899_g7890